MPIDDPQDNSALRRGGPTAHIMYGVPTAINAGTAAYFLGEGITREQPNLTEQQACAGHVTCPCERT